MDPRIAIPLLTTVYIHDYNYINDTALLACRRDDARTYAWWKACLALSLSMQPYMYTQIV